MEDMEKILTLRQEKILNCVVGEYIDSKAPVSSKILSKKYHFGIKPPTIRIELQKLTEMGFLTQPHTSAGRIPTDKGYRFYVDNLRPQSKNNKWRSLEEEMNDSFSFFQLLTKRIAGLTSNVAMSYFPEEDIFFKEGWDNIFNEPEFEDIDLASKFTKLVENMERSMPEFEEFDFPKVFIGNENPIQNSQEFSVIISRIHLSDKKDGLLALLGPKRMDYNKNVDIINFLNKTCQTKKK